MAKKKDVSIRSGAAEYLTFAASTGDSSVEMDDRAILTDSGSITAEIAKAYAETEFEKYRIVQDRLYESDFDRFLAMEDVK